MKRFAIALLVLSVCLIISCAYAEQDGLYTYQVNEDNTITITGFDWKNNHGDIYIPEMLGNRLVSAIGEQAFATTDNTAIKITLPDTIHSIDNQAFRGVAITYVNIPLSVVEIGDGAFAECSVMRFNVDNGHTVFATIDNVLYNKQTKTLIAWPINKEISDIPKGIKGIGAYAFYGRDFSDGSRERRRYILPETVEIIGEYAFAGVRQLSLVANHVVTICDHAFEGANLMLETSKVSVIGDYAFYKAGIKFTSKLSLSQIGGHAFEESNLQIFESEENMNLLSQTPYEIGEYAFAHCTGTSHLILKNVTSIGPYAFEGIISGRSANLDIRLEPNDLEKLSFIGENAFYDTNISTWGNNSMGYHAYADLINSELKIIPKEAFYYTYITDLKIGPTVAEIGEGAFEKCEVLESVELSNGLHTIGARAFSGCKELTEIIIPETVTTIGDKAFSDCTKLTAISIPRSVTMIGNDVFTGCTESFVVTVEAGTYGEVWARTCGYSYVVNGQVDDLSWLE